jgi:hypothetical protein
MIKPLPGSRPVKTGVVGERNRLPFVHAAATQPQHFLFIDCKRPALEYK